MEEKKLLDLIKSGLKTELSEDERKALQDKIPAYKPEPEIIILYPLYMTESKLAAASTVMKEIESTSTFADNEQKFLIKVIREDKVSKLFIFTASDELLYNVHIQIMPSKEKFLLPKSDKPLIINSIEEISEIKLSF